MIAGPVRRGQPAEPSQRLFFALWPDEALQGVLAERVPGLLASHPGRPQRPDQWHLTLEFLGSVAPDRLEAVEEAASAVAGEPFSIRFDRIEHWRRPAVLCLVASAVPEPLSALVSALRETLAARGFEPERREYRPHLTLARKVARAPRGQPIEPLIWPATGFVLAESVAAPGANRYVLRRRWPLAG